MGKIVQHRPEASIFDFKRAHHTFHLCSRQSPKNKFGAIEVLFVVIKLHVVVTHQCLKFPCNSCVLLGIQ